MHDASAPPARRPRNRLPPLPPPQPQAAAEALGVMLEGVTAWLATRPKDRRPALLLANVLWSFAHGVAMLTLDNNLKGARWEEVLDTGLAGLLGD